MGIVYTNKLKPGMVVADAVRDVNGRLLLGKGNRIDKSHLRIFKIWGITEVNVRGEVGIKDKPEPHIHPELIEKIKDKTTQMFSLVDMDHPAIKEIFRISVDYRSRNNVSQKDTPSLSASNGNGKSKTNGDFLKRLSDKKIFDFLFHF